MNPEVYNFDFGIDAEYLVFTWTRLQHVSDIDAQSRYPELTMRVKYRDICTDTVIAMLRDLEVPQQISQAILTLIAAQTT